MSKEEKIDLGNIRGQTGEKGRGIVDIIRTESYPFETYDVLQINYTDGTSETLQIYHPPAPSNTITPNNDSPITSGAVYNAVYGEDKHSHNDSEIHVDENTTLETKLTTIESEIDTLRKRSIVKVVNSLPSSESQVEKGAIYLVQSSNTDTQNVMEEYVWDDDNKRFEHIGEFNLNLANYLQGSNITNTVSSTVTVLTCVSPQAVYNYAYSRDDIDDMIGDIQEFIHS